MASFSPYFFPSPKKSASSELAEIRNQPENTRKLRIFGAGGHDKGNCIFLESQWDFLFDESPKENIIIVIKRKHKTRTKPAENRKKKNARGPIPGYPPPGQGFP